MLASIALLLAAIQPQDAGPPPERDIVVTARREANAERVQRFARAVSLPVDGQLATFRVPICPVVSGMPAEQGGRIVRRMRRVAAQAGIRVGGSDCEPNIVIIFTENGQRLVREAYRRGRRMFAGLDSVAAHRILNSEEPVRAWRSAHIESTDGQTEGRQSSALEGRSGGRAANVGTTLKVETASILSLPTRQVVTNAFLVIEQSAAIGKTLTQLADYAVMRTLAGVRPTSGANAADETILSLIEDVEHAPSGLTELDQAYLRALYRVRPSQRFTQQVGQISTMMTRDLASGQPR